jgi:hypothetical protein
MNFDKEYFDLELGYTVGVHGNLKYLLEEGVAITKGYSHFWLEEDGTLSGVTDSGDREPLGLTKKV